MKTTSYLAISYGLTAMTASTVAANAQTLPDAPVDVQSNDGVSGGLEDIVVTAQKRRQSVNDVGLSITALSGDQITRRGITSAYDLVKVVPGLSVANAGNGATVVYTLRGIGFNASFLGATSAVAVYQDEVAFPYPAMTGGLGLDLERVEVLKGPQGTLFGQNSTAGAINYIANKPTEEFSGYANASYGRFNWFDVRIAAGGAITDTLRARFAISHEGGDGWQKSYTRNDTLGQRDNTKARAMLTWDPTPDFRAALTVNYWRDQSDTQALQLVRYEPLQPPGRAGLNTYPTAPQNARAADWSPDKSLRFGTTLFQPSLRLDLDVTPGITVTSLTAYSDYKTDSYLDGDGTTFEDGEIQQFGNISDFNQELRISGRSSSFDWVLGGNYQSNDINENLNIFIRDLSNVQNIGGSGFGAILSPVFSRQKTDAKAVFGNAEYRVDDRFSVVAGARYTKTKIGFRGCNLDSGPPIPDQPNPGVTASLRGFFNILYGVLTGNVGANPIGEGECVTLDNVSRDGNPPTFLPTESPQTLSEDNFSWNLTANFKPTPQALVYARVAQGYKSGSFPTIGASTSVQFNPAKQEGLRAYEAGVKLTLLDRRLQLDGAVFYYDYTNKQLSNFVPDAVFGPLVAIVNIPDSEVTGAEVATSLAPIDGLTISAAATYIDSKIKTFVGFDEGGALTDFQGARFNLAPKWSGSADVDYRFPVGEGLTGSIGGGMTYRSSTTGILGTVDPDYSIDAYTLFDAQAGIESSNGWSLQVFGRNITNKYYWSNVNRVSDTIVRVAGLPATYGVTFGYKF